MSTTFVKVPGTVKFYNSEKGFGFIKTAQGDVFMPSRVAGSMAEALISGAAVVIDHITRYINGGYKLEATALISVEPLPSKPKPISVLDTVIWFDPGKGFGFINCGGAGLSKDQAHMHVSVAEKACVIPGPDMPIRALIEESKKGPRVLSFEWGEAVEVAYKAQLAALHAEDGAATTPETPTPKKRQRRAPAKVIAPKKPKAAKKAPEAPRNVITEVASCASALNGSGGAMADALCAATASTAH